MAGPFDFNAPQQVETDGGDYPPTRRGEPPRSRLVYILLALFIGFLGVHNFYAGRAVQGLAQLFIFIVSWPLMLVIIGFVTLPAVFLWVLLDVVTVKKDGRGKWMM